MYSPDAARVPDVWMSACVKVCVCLFLCDCRIVCRCACGSVGFLCLSISTPLCRCVYVCMFPVCECVSALSFCVCASVRLLCVRTSSPSLSMFARMCICFGGCVPAYVFSFLYVSVPVFASSCLSECVNLPCQYSACFRFRVAVPARVF